MKDNKSDNELYQQFMNELEDGAKEYDRLLASGEAPVKKAMPMKPSRSGWWTWAAAACVLIAVAICGVRYMNNIDDDDGRKETLAHKDGRDDTKKVGEQATKGKEEEQNVREKMLEERADKDILVAKTETPKPQKKADNGRQSVMDNNTDIAASILLDDIVIEYKAEEQKQYENVASNGDETKRFSIMLNGDRIIKDGDNTYYICDNCGDNSLRINDIYINSNLPTE